MAIYVVYAEDALYFIILQILWFLPHEYPSLGVYMPPLSLSQLYFNDKKLYEFVCK